MFMLMNSMVVKVGNRLFPLMFLLLLVSSCSKQRRGPYEPAKVEYDKTDLNLGDVYIEDGERVIEYHVKNVGDHPLSVYDVVSSCDCTTIQFDENKQLYRDDEITIHVTFNPQDVPVGEFERMVGVYTSLKKRPDTLYFHGVAKHK